MIKNELIRLVESSDNHVEFYKLKFNIIKELSNTAYSKKLSIILSFVDFYAEKTHIINALKGKKELKRR